MKDSPVSYPALRLLDHGVDLNFRQREIQIGSEPGSHIALAGQGENEIQALIKTDGEKWMLCVKGRRGIWLNERFYTKESGDLLLKTGDILRAGALRLQFLMTLPERESQMTEQEFLQIPHVNSSLEVATESLRIVKPPPVFRTLPGLAVHASTAAIIILVSYWLTMGKARDIRNYLAKKFPEKQQNTPVRKTVPTFAMKKAFEKNAPVKSTHTVNIFDILAHWFSSYDLSLGLSWRSNGETPLVWADQKGLDCKQSELFERVREGKLAKAENLYTGKIYPHLYSAVKSMENAIKYNGWAIRLLRLAKEWQAHKDPKVRQQLVKELEILHMQTELYVKSPENKRSFKRLHNYITQKLRQED